MPKPLVRLHINSSVQLFTPVGDAKFWLVGPLDEDKDGNPEVELRIDLPGQGFDRTITAELEWLQLCQAPLRVVRSVLESAPDFPAKANIVAVLDALDGED